MKIRFEHIIILMLVLLLISSFVVFYTYISFQPRNSNYNACELYNDWTLDRLPVRCYGYYGVTK